MRPIPADLQLDPMPTDFTCNITQDKGTLKATAVIDGESYEIGIRGMGTADEIAYLKGSVWQLHEFSRVGRVDLMRYASAHRHTRR